MKKSIVIDLYKTRDLYTGLGQFSLYLARAIYPLLKDDFELIFHVPHSKISIAPYAKTINSSFINRYLPNRQKEYDLWHSLHQFPSHLPHPNTPQILTIHDLNFIIEKGEKKAKKYLKKLQKNIEKAEKITCISEFTKRNIEHFLNTDGKPIDVIYNGVELEKTEGDYSNDFNIKGKFFLNLNVFKPSKNIDILLPLVHHFKEHQLVLAGSNNTAYGDYIRQMISKHDLQNRVILTGKVNPAQKYWLYNNCDAFLFPSKAEGFGMPIIEAMHCGKPVVIGNYASLPEIAGNKAYYCNSPDFSDLVETIRYALYNYELNKEDKIKEIQAHAREFTWKKAAEKYALVYRSVLEKY